MDTYLQKITTPPAISKPRLTFRGISLAFVIYTLYSLFFTFLIVQQDPEHLIFWSIFISIFIGIFFGNLLEGVFSLIPWFIVIREMNQARWPAKFAAHAVLAPLFAWGWYESYVWLFRTLFGASILKQAQLVENKLWVIYGAFTFYVIQFAIIHVIRSIQKLREREKQAALLQDLAREREIAALKAQINPHFLFNTLNTINAAISQNPEEARQMIAQLADLLRYALQSFNRDFVKLNEELQFVQTYLTFEQKRFSDRLVVETDISESILDTPIPPMILQPLVENSVRHGIAPSVNGGKIYLQIVPNEDQLRFTLRDTGAGSPNQPAKSLFENGVGLKNTDTRLRQLFGDAAGLQIHNLKDHGFEVCFSLPLNQQD